MFNERGMTSRQPFGSRLSMVLEEGSANAASTGSEPVGRFGKAFMAVRSPRGTDVLAQQAPPRLLAAAVPCASLGKAPRSYGRRGTCWHRGGLAPCLAPAWSTQPHSPAPWHLAWGGCNIHRRGRDMPAFAMSWALES